MPDRDWSASTARTPADPDRPAAGWATFAAISDAHGAHLFDYCCALGREDDALAAAQVALSDAASRDFPPDLRRLRAWLFGRARLELVGATAGGRGRPRYAPAGVLGRYRAAGSRAGDADWADGWRDGEAAWSAVTAFRALPDQLREVLDLAYRHGIHSEDLPTVLGLPAEEAAWLLVSAEETFSQLAALAVPPGQGRPAATEGFALEHLADFPLIPLPPEFWERGWPDQRGTAQHLAGDGTSVLPGGLAAHLRTSARFPAGRRIQAAGLAATVVIAVGATLGYIAFQGQSNGGGQTTLAGGTSSARSGLITPAAPAATTTSPSHAAARHSPAAAPSLRTLLSARNQSGSTPPTVAPTVTAKPAPRKTSKPKPSASAHPSSSAHPSTSASASPSSSPSASPSSSPDPSTSPSASPDPSSSADPSPSATTASSPPAS